MSRFEAIRSLHDGHSANNRQEKRGKREVFVGNSIIIRTMVHSHTPNPPASPPAHRPPLYSCVSLAASH